MLSDAHVDLWRGAVIGLVMGHNWRRIQVWDDTLDKLHEHLQAAMGWTHSHLHEFIIQGQRCGGPDKWNTGPALPGGGLSVKIDRAPQPVGRDWARRGRSGWAPVEVTLAD